MLIPYPVLTAATVFADQMHFSIPRLVDSSLANNLQQAKGQDQPQQNVPSPPALTATGPRVQQDLLNRVLTYPEGAVAQYGVTTIIADYMQIDNLRQRGIARGHVHIIDPDGRVDGSEIEFLWGAGATSGTAKDFVAWIDSLHLEAGNAIYTPARLELDKATVSSSGHSKGLFAVDSPRIVLVPGKYMRITRPQITFLGITLPRIKTLTVNQDPRVKGVGLPTVSISNGAPGVSYSPNFLVTPRSSLQTWVNVYRAALPRYGAEYSYSFLDPSIRDQGRISPISDLEARFGYGYFDNIVVQSPEQEFALEKLHRSSVAVDSQANQGAGDRLPGGAVSKALEFVYENGGPIGPLAQISHVRLQSVREQGQSNFIQRSVFDTSVGLPPIQLYRGVNSLFRLDGQGFAGGNTFAWVRGQAGISFRPFRRLTLSAAYITAKEFGTPDLTVDQLYTNGGLSYRADLRLGSLTASYLQRYDLSGQFYDDEYVVTQAVGSLRASLQYRRFPSDFRFGLTLRLDDFIRTVKRNHGDPPKDELPVALFP